ncbi:MAG: hypothetical protein EXQ69_07550 [Acidimicrobiia bacterium]|nr:hypothetical protein [Acidimicrobiia bacterium]
MNEGGARIIEFFGLPGSGKSYLARELVDFLRLSGVPTSEPMSSLGPHASKVERAFGKASRATTEIVRSAAARNMAWRVGTGSSQRDARDRIARPLNLLVARNVTQRARLFGGVHVIDQGLLNEWWSAAIRGDEESVLSTLADDAATSPLPDLLVRVDAPAEVIADRLEQRTTSQSRLENQSRPNLLEELSRGTRLFDKIEYCLQAVLERRGVLVLRVNTMDPLAIKTIAAVAST